MKNQVSVLDTIYRIEQREDKDDPQLTGLSGYCDAYEKLIVIRKNWDFTPKTAMIKHILRHEIAHAFFYESGLWDDSSHNEAWATNEEMVDWFAIQGPKIYKAWQEVDAL